MVYTFYRLGVSYILESTYPMLLFIILDGYNTKKKEIYK